MNASVPDIQLYSAALSVLDRMREGLTLTEACKRTYVTRARIMGLMHKDSTFRKMLTEATLESEDTMADLLINIDQHYPDPKMAKVISDNIKWLLARRRGADYGDRMVVEQKSTSQDEAIITALNEAMKRIPIPAQNLEQPAPMIDVTPTAPPTQ